MKSPIGFFDSGVGGTTIWNEVQELLPLENTIYLADSKHAPYGQKTKEEIIQLCIKNTEYLLNQNCKLIVVACNTATTNAIRYLREKYNVPFIGIEPAIKPAGIVTKSRRIGILATKGTLNSELFEKTSSNLDDDITIVEQVGEHLVELIEANKIDSNEMKSLLSSYLQPMIDKGIDALVLGCSHYPYLIPVIKEIIGQEIKIIDSGLAVAKQTKRVLKQHQLLTENQEEKIKHTFYTNTSTDTLKILLKAHLNHITIEQKYF